MIFVDTSAWFAYFLPTDVDHDRVRAHLHGCREPFVTSDYVVDETLTLLLARGEKARALEAGRAFFQANIAQLHFVAQQQVFRAWIQFQQCWNLGWSFTDCTSFVVITDLGVGTAATLDAHFRQFPNLEVGP